MAANGKGITLKDDYCSPSGEGTNLPDPLGAPLTAYQIGQTNYTPSEIKDVGNQIIQDMGSYSLFESNCQHFMIMLSVNILMRRDNTIFVGTTKQITRWDLGSKRTGGHSNGVDRGYAIIAPQKSSSALKDIMKWSMDSSNLKLFLVSLRNYHRVQDPISLTSTPDELWKRYWQDHREGRWMDGLFGRKVVYYEAET